MKRGKAAKALLLGVLAMGLVSCGSNPNTPLLAKILPPAWILESPSRAFISKTKQLNSKSAKALL